MAFSYIPGPSQGGPSLAQSTVSFAPPVYYTAGNNPQDVAVGDVNGDGKLDLVVANATSNDVSVLLGAGAGTFGAATTLSEGAGSSPRAVAIADLNGDAKLDLAIAHCGGSVGIRLNTGAVGASPPSFNGPTNFNVGGSSTSCPTVIATGNFNGGKPDLATANFNTDNASVLLNSTVTGSTTPMFSVSDLASAGDQPSSVALADLNGDGKLDLAVAIAGTSADRVEVRLGNGDGTFSATWQQVAMGGSGSNPAGVVAADFNGDGKPDLVTADFGHNDLSVRLNTTSAGSTTLTFGPVVNYATSTSSTPQPTSLAVADLNRDGKLDLAVANYGSGQVAVLLGNGDGTFGTAITYNVGTNPVAVATGDFNGDGWPDLVVVRANVSTNNVVVLLNQPPPTPTPTSTSTPTVTATATS
ncbi:MAG: VCBS repeat-containing protein, partial [Chloroflexi bacterium]|nr:VCBS repeat-containing protein [Chloroflexota bacterium]